MTIALQVHEKTANEAVNVRVSFLGKLEDGELLTGTPTAVELVTSDLSITNVAVNTSTIPINGIDHLPGQAVIFSVSGGLAATSEYCIKTKGGSDAVPTQTPEIFTKLVVTGDC